MGTSNQPDGFDSYCSLVLNPRYEFTPYRHLGGYATGGYCDPFTGYCYDSGAPVVAEFANFKGGFNLGGGVTYAVGDVGMKVFTDVRFNRFLAHHSNDWMSVTFGIRF